MACYLPYPIPCKKCLKASAIFAGCSSSTIPPQSANFDYLNFKINFKVIKLQKFNTLTKAELAGSSLPFVSTTSSS